MDTSDSKEGNTTLEERVDFNMNITKSFLDKITAFSKKHGLPNNHAALESAMSVLLQMDEDPNTTLSFLMNGKLRIEHHQC